MSRLDRSPDDYLASKLGELRQTLDSLRQPQTFGASDVRIYRLFSQSGTPDIVLTGLTTTTRAIEVTLTPTTPVPNPAIAFDFAFTVVYTSGTGNYFYYQVPLAPVGGVQKFRVYLQMVSGTVNANIFFTFFTVSQATYSAVEISP